MTVADFTVQGLVAQRLAQAFPGDPLIAEEDAASLEVPEGQPILQAVLSVLHCAVSELAVNQVLELIDRGPGDAQ